MVGTRRAQLSSLLLLVSRGRAVLALGALARSLLVAVVLSAAVTAAVSAPAAGEPSALLVGAAGLLLCAVALARSAAVVLPAAADLGPVVAARDHHRALARRAVPRLRDPDAPGRTRSRAPSGLLPAAP